MFNTLPPPPLSLPLCVCGGLGGRGGMDVCVYRYKVYLFILLSSQLVIDADR